MPPEYFFENDPLKITGDHHPILIMCDFDGTLVPIQGDPQRCFLFPDIRKLLELITHSGNSTVAILSGRSLSDLRKRVSIKDVYLSGSHGLEVSGPNMNYVHPKAATAKSIIDGIRRDLEKKIGNIQGILIEKKTFAFTLHYRMAIKKNKVIAQRAFYESVSEHTGSQKKVAILKGKQVLELTPDVEWDKGKACLLILKQLRRPYLPVYIGDDVTDEAAFRALSTNGTTVRVGKSKKTAAQYYLRHQWEILQFLEYIDKAGQYRHRKESP